MAEENSSGDRSSSMPQRTFAKISYHGLPVREAARVSNASDDRLGCCRSTSGPVTEGNLVLQIRKKMRIEAHAG